MPKNVKVTKESQTGRNKEFFDPSQQKTMTRAQFSNEIDRGNYPDYHVRKTNGLRTPASNPDKKSDNNLG